MFRNPLALRYVFRKNMCKYQNVLNDFELLTEIAYDLSQQFDGIFTDDKRKRISTHILAKVVSGCISMLKLIPGSNLCKDEYLDFSSVSSLCRNLLEAANIHWYYAIEDIDELEVDFRFVLFSYHDTYTLLAISENLKFLEEDIDYLRNQLGELKEEIESNSHYISMSKDIKKQIIKGKRGAALTQTQITERRNIDLKTYKGIYKILSNHIHSTPAAITSVAHSRLHDKELDEIFTGLILSYSADYLADMIKNIGEQWELEFDKLESKEIVFEYAERLNENT